MSEKRKKYDREFREGAPPPQVRFDSSPGGQDTIALHTCHDAASSGLEASGDW